jgi:hypothetical protein
MGSVVPLSKLHQTSIPCFAESTVLICQAFDQVCTALRETGQSDSFKHAVAKRLIEIANLGARDPAEMSAATLISLGLKRNRFVISPRRLVPVRLGR